MNNIPEVKIGLVAVSRDCFPRELSQKRRDAVTAEIRKLGALENEIFTADTIVENELDALKVLEELKEAQVNALVVYLGNYGPEGAETLLAQRFSLGKNPVMFAAAAEESGNDLFAGRGDAYCGMLSASYNIGLRGLRVHIPDYPVAPADEIAKMIAEFEPVARIYIGVNNLKVFSFGPRPYDVFACNAPIKPFYDLGTEIQENSELDLFAFFQEHKDDPRTSDIIRNMEKELGKKKQHAPIIGRMAQYELTLMDWAEKNRDSSSFCVFANKCWPAFQTQFGFAPCYVHSRLTSRGIPVSCETDIYGALSEYIITLATKKPPALLDINNTVPADMVKENKEKFGSYKNTDLFMGYHCGNTPFCYLKDPEIKHQFFMQRSLETNGKPDITRGTLEGTIKSGKITLFRLQATAETQLKSYAAEGEILNVPPKSFGGIGIFAVPEMGRFYRHVLIEKRYPHHTGVAFDHVGKTLFDAMKLFGVTDVAFNQPAGMLYRGENPFS